MIHGTVNHKRVAEVSLRLRGPQGSLAEILAIVDTGYNGALTLPGELVEELGLESKSSGEAELADGTIVDFDVYEAEVEWGNDWLPVSISAVGEEPLLGMRLLAGHELR